MNCKHNVVVSVFESSVSELSEVNVWILLGIVSERWLFRKESDDEFWKFQNEVGIVELNVQYLKLNQVKLVMLNNHMMMIIHQLNNLNWIEVIEDLLMLKVSVVHYN